MIATLVRKSSDSSKIYCEDSLFVKQNSWCITGGIFDGCGSGKKSHWASQTLAYLFEQCAEPQFSALSVSYVIGQMEKLSSALGRDHMHFLSTCMLFLYHKQQQTLSVRVFGDGVYYVDGIRTEIDQNNEPDYLGYYMWRSTQEIAEYVAKSHYKEYQVQEGFQICSDGINSLSTYQFEQEPRHKDPLKLLLSPPQTPNYLERMWNILERDGYILRDDLSIISYTHKTPE